MREKENDLTGGILIEEHKAKQPLNEEQKIDKNNKAKEKSLREKENDNERSGLNEEQKNLLIKEHKAKKPLNEEQKIDKNNKVKEKILRKK